MRFIAMSGWAVVAFASLPAFAEDTAAKACCVPSVEIQQLIAKVGARHGIRFVVDPRVRAEVAVTGFDVEKVDYSQLLTILDVNQFATYRQGDLVVVLPDANARSLPTPVYTDLAFKEDANEYVTLMKATKNACAAHLVPVLRPLMPQAAHLAAEIQSNTLIINDRASNVRRIADMVDRIDRGAPAGRGCLDFPSSAPAKKRS